MYNVDEERLAIMLEHINQLDENETIEVLIFYCVLIEKVLLSRLSKSGITVIDDGSNLKISVVISTNKEDSILDLNEIHQTIN